MWAIDDLEVDPVEEPAPWEPITFKGIPLVTDAASGQTYFYYFNTVTAQVNTPRANGIITGIGYDTTGGTP